MVAMRQMPSAQDVALLVALNHRRKEEELGRELPRLRMSKRALRKISRRKKLDGRFIDNINIELSELDRILISTGTVMGLIRLSSVEGWTRLNVERIVGEVADIKAGRLNHVAVWEELAPEFADQEEDQEDDDE